MARPLTLAQALFSQGFGTRRECHALIAAGEVCLDGQVCDDPWHELNPDGLHLRVQGVDWPYHEKALIALHKPVGYECSQKPRHHPGVLGLLPAPLRTRGVQPVGRLDADSTGLLLLTDDGTLIHRLTSPKRHVEKVYEVGCAEPVSPDLVEQLLSGVQLLDTPAPVRAAACEATGERSLRMTLTEGRYHQVKRMVVAAGNHVKTLHRSRFGAFELPATLAPGAWCWLDDAHEVLPASDAQR